MEDLTKQPGNPSYELQRHYQELMAIDDPEELKERAAAIVAQFVGSGFSKMNWKRFKLNLERSAQHGVDSIKKYITNFILAGAGLRVVEELGPEAIATFIDDMEVVTLTPYQRMLQEMVRETLGMDVCLLDDVEFDEII